MSISSSKLRNDVRINLKNDRDYMICYGKNAVKTSNNPFLPGWAFEQMVLNLRVNNDLIWIIFANVSQASYIFFSIHLKTSNFFFFKDFGFSKYLNL